ncbi:MAG: 50S ribosomal protein L11 [Nanoarchaeota archaeon]|nr:50S ribosomal protein L11 [Nanoarchaeota archaeon]MBU4116964.1 50S ribosomal protein L11 [Nanoarchaeota archaeon]
MKMRIKLLVEGGSMKPGPALSQKLGPAGININQVIQKVNEATKNFDGLKVPVELDVNPSTKDFEIMVFSPPVSELLKKELGIAKGSGMQIKSKIANASIEQIILVAKTKLQNMLCKDLKSAVKTVVGSCVSLGVLVENKPAAEIEQDIDEGKYDKEIKEEKTEVSAEKKAELEKYFAEVKDKQDKLMKLEEKEKEEKEQAKEVKPEEKVEDKAKEEKKELPKTKKK